ncbi:hypothetical protein DRQ53_02965 [bacterium]|nr:MAG: hypothetical protein DRQ32_03270 [bacterium]RKZ17617.1 MAG: hypothetical protein DRQ53_02965 [bacterium]
MIRFILLAILVSFFVLRGVARPRDEAPVQTPAQVQAEVQDQASADLTAVQARLDALEAENQDLREELATLGAGMRVNSSTTAPLLDRYPVPARLELCGEQIPLERADVHQRFEEEWTRYLVNQHWLIKWDRRARDIFPYVESQLAAAGMPDDLKYVLIVESGLESRAYSSAGAAGWWQFIHATGKRYGLTRNSVVDERRDLGLATEAAIAYFTKLYDEFQSWPLALSAYNAGEKRVRDELKRQGESSFYDLSLPRETEAYWFKAAAIKVLMENQRAYGLSLPDDPWVATVCDTMQVKVTADRLQLRDLASGAGISYRAFRELNPAFRKSWVPRGTHRLVIPREGIDAMVAGLEGARVVERLSGEPVRTVQRADVKSDAESDAESEVEGTVPLETKPGLGPAH